MFFLHKPSIFARNLDVWHKIDLSLFHLGLIPRRPCARLRRIFKPHADPSLAIRAAYKLAISGNVHHW